MTTTEETETLSDNIVTDTNTSKTKLEIDVKEDIEYYKKVNNEQSSQIENLLATLNKLTKDHTNLLEKKKQNNNIVSNDNRTSNYSWKNKLVGVFKSKSQHHTPTNAILKTKSRKETLSLDDFLGKYMLNRCFI